MSESKVVVAVDIDEVLAKFVETLAEYHNKHYGTTLTISCFHSYHFSDVWGGSDEEAMEKVTRFLHSEEFSNLPMIEESYPVLKELHDTGKFKFVVVTSRQTSISEITHNWINKHYPGIFASIKSGNHYGFSSLLQPYLITQTHW
eukprot:TRINITY_DN8521_c0_g1_i1.p1 TRINITY_DN8521_c0_g1~~TRINITY_DN8521_c0_g1_i1.p1  ORF type:complete len:145 (-),score=26.78 TRINITY_DN8521_c0_g1_i1:267-701(-)